MNKLTLNIAESIIEQWLNKTIIGLNLCPFAKKPYEDGQLRIKSYAGEKEEDQIRFFLDEITLIQSDSKINTSLLIFEKAHKDFINFYNLSGLFEDLLAQLKLADEFQVVCFHPKFVFENLDSKQRVNFVNRSHIPLIHIIRSIDIENALSGPQEGEQISFNNEKTLNNLSDAEFLEHFPSTFYPE